MAVDYTKNTYTITNINENGTVCVTFDVDGKNQCLAGAPLDDANALKDFLDNYLTAYVSGLQTQDVAVDSDVSALIGKKQTAETDQEA